MDPGEFRILESRGSYLHGIPCSGIGGRPETFCSAFLAQPPLFALAQGGNTVYPGICKRYRSDRCRPFEISNLLDRVETNRLLIIVS